MITDAAWTLFNSQSLTSPAALGGGFTGVASDYIDLQQIDPGGRMLYLHLHFEEAFSSDSTLHMVLWADGAHDLGVVNNFALITPQPTNVGTIILSVPLYTRFGSVAKGAHVFVPFDGGAGVNLRPSLGDTLTTPPRYLSLMFQYSSATTGRVTAKLTDTNSADWKAFAAKNST